MARLSEQLRDWLARAEILAHGAERRRSRAMRALADGRPAEARTCAHELLDELPRSPVALAMLADATEAMMLDDEHADALDRLAREVPFRADVWLRLARARERQGEDSSVALERAALAGEPRGAADEARLALADRDLARGDAARAERWLDGVGLALQRTPEVLRRRAEVCLELGDVEGANDIARGLPEPDALDGRGWLLRGRLLALASDPNAAHALERALLLDAPGAERVVARAVATTRDAVVLERVREILGDRTGRPVWTAAIATAEGRTDDALAALASAARSDSDAARGYLEAALEHRRPDALEHAVKLASECGDALPAGVRALSSALGEQDDSRRLDLLDSAGGVALDWASREREAVYAAWCPRGGLLDWPRVLGETGRLARDLGEVEAVREAETVAVDLERPLRVAVVGEFNAGKSTFINALLGEPVAPVGVLPTTATVNRLVWAPDPFARIERDGQDDRVVAHADLGAALAEVGADTVRQVVIYAPLEALRHVELVDTPGFNAPDQSHAARARAGLRDAHVAVWLLDATQPLKESERAVLAELGDVDLPLLVLVNKIDRLAGDAAIEEAVEHVRRGLEGAGVVVEAPPVPFSARLALAGRAGDPSALVQSEWSAVTATFDAAVVGRSAELRDRVLRRRVRGTVGRLREAAERRDEERRRRARDHRARREASRRAAARVEEGREQLEAALAGELDDCLADLDRDLRPLAGARHDLTSLRYVADRARSIVGRALLGRSEAALGVALPVVLEARLGALVAGSVAALLVDDTAERAVARDRLATLAVVELRLALEAAAVSGADDEEASAALLRVRALAAVLE